MGMVSLLLNSLVSLFVLIIILIIVGIIGLVILFVGCLIEEAKENKNGFFHKVLDALDDLDIY